MRTSDIGNIACFPEDQAKYKTNQCCSRSNNFFATLAALLIRFESVDASAWWFPLPGSMCLCSHGKPYLFPVQYWLFWCKFLIHTGMNGAETLQSHWKLNYLELDTAKYQLCICKDCLYCMVLSLDFRPVVPKNGFILRFVAAHWRFMVTWSLDIFDVDRRLIRHDGRKCRFAFRYPLNRISFENRTALPLVRSTGL